MPVQQLVFQFRHAALRQFAQHIVDHVRIRRAARHERVHGDHVGDAADNVVAALEDAAGAPGKATIPIGTRVQSLPGQDEKPQSFETVEAISAEAAWNEMKPRTTRLVYPGFQEDEVYLKGVSNNLKAGDALLIVGTERLNDTTNENWDFRRIKSVETVTATDLVDSYTLVTLEYGLESISDQSFGGFAATFSPTNHVASKFVELSMLTGDGRVRT